jgi:ankyrin repeat protein
MHRSSGGRSNRMAALVMCAPLIFGAATLGATFGNSVSPQAKPAPMRKIDEQLLEAVSAGGAVRVADLIAKGANVNARNEAGETALHLAQTRRIAELLLSKGADHSLKNDDFLMTPIFNAPLEVVEVLISRGADVNAKAKDGLTPLGWACYWDSFDRIKLLVAKGADVNAGAGSAKTPLHIAANWGKMPFVEFLISKGAHVNAVDESGWAPLHWAAFEGGPEVAGFLITKGADKDARTGKSWGIFPEASTPLDVATRAKAGDMVMFLKSRGCRSGKDIRHQGDV